MASFKAKFPVLQELFAKNHRGALWPPSAGRGLSAGAKCSAVALCTLHTCTVRDSSATITFPDRNASDVCTAVGLRQVQGLS